MKNDTVTVTMDAEKLHAIKFYMGKKSADLEPELREQLLRLYEKYVPASVREYIDEGTIAPNAIPKVARSTSKSQEAGADGTH